MRTLVAVASLCTALSGFASPQPTSASTGPAADRPATNAKSVSEKIEKAKYGGTITIRTDAAGHKTSVVERTKDGYVVGKEFFSAGQRTMRIEYMAGCGVGLKKWTPQLATVTVYRSGGKLPKYEQGWSCDDNGVPQELFGVSEYDNNGRILRTWEYGANNTIQSITVHASNGAVIDVRLNSDGTVSSQTTFNPPAKPKKETFKGKAGGVHKIDPSLTRFPSALERY